jgi:hypothetical protein
MQVPGNFSAASHTLLREVAARSPRADEFLPRLRAGGAGAPSSARSLLAVLNRTRPVLPSHAAGDVGYAHNRTVRVADC